MAGVCSGCWRAGRRGAGPREISQVPDTRPENWLLRAPHQPLPATPSLLAHPTGCSYRTYNFQLHPPRQKDNHSCTHSCSRKTCCCNRLVSAQADASCRSTKHSLHHKNQLGLLVRKTCCAAGTDEASQKNQRTAWSEPV